ncbi:MAG: tRNA glutamyl-Q(34) synthetase GluQRS [Acidobacteria bacterium]|nr:tRNA glutamyl-Q(34) synthetase GluQRS [Acidobacteriota bacterium]
MAESYCGRFAPSPTGPLHFGSLVAAVGSWLDARRAGGRWLVRIEDIDVLRCVPGADGDILRTLEAYALDWDEEVVWQTRRHDLYRAALESLSSKVFPCSCARKPRYDGACRNGTNLPPRTIRLRVPDALIRFEDRRLGAFEENLEATCGDFILKRADGLYAYQLAVVVDDADQRITDVVRGADLLDSTARQIWLQRQLGVPTPRYLHLPVALGSGGEKLSKQTGAPPIPPHGDVATLRKALAFLGVQNIEGATCREILARALAK